MQYTTNVFPSQLNFTNCILAILVLLFSCGLYHALYSNILKKIMQQLFFASRSIQKSVDRSIVYLLLASFPMILLIIVSLFYNQSLIGIQISLTFDELNILIVTGYICWIQQSRHTPLRGICLIRDILFSILIIGLLIGIFYHGNINMDYAISIGAVFLVYYFTNVFYESLEEFILKVFGLKQSNAYNAKFLLTSKHTIPDFLEIKDIISQKSDIIQQELQDFKQILTNLQQNEQDQQILMNFARLFLPIKRAYELKQHYDNQQVLKQIQDDWSQGSVTQNPDRDQQNDLEQPIRNSPTWNSSSDGIGFTLKNSYTYTEDYINQEEQKGQISLYQKVLKYVYYPIYLGSFAQGRLFYLISYIALAILTGAIFGISNAASYFSYQMNSLSLVSTIISILLIYPSTRYWISISTDHDYDFTNIFIQCMILKITVVGVCLAAYNIFFASIVEINKGAFTLLIIRMGLLVGYLVFMVWNRFATRFDNIKWFGGFFIVATVARVFSENVYNSV